MRDTATIVTLLVVLLGVGVSPAWAGRSVREPAVAGQFYPGEPDALRGTVNALLEQAPEVERPGAVLVPHAGFPFSGATAARAFRGLDGASVDRVILLGPSHRQRFSGGALPAPHVEAFRTPLGVLPLDTAVIRALRSSDGFDGPAKAHADEHCLEVELPFLQATVGRVPIVPILVGGQTDRDVARRMARALAEHLDPRTVVVVSSDFTHHGRAYGHRPFDREGLGDRLLELGRATAGRAVEVDPRGFWLQVRASGDTVCGAAAVTVALELLDHAFDGGGRLLGITTSGHVTGRWDQSVTYVAAAWNGTWRAWRGDPARPKLGRLTDSERRALPELARATLRSHIGGGGELAHWFGQHDAGGNLDAVAGAFVTLRDPAAASEGGSLRACMGSIVGTEPLLEAVVHAAVSAAHDPRFPELRLEELEGLSIEVSALSPLRPVPGPDAIRLGTHGVVLEKRGRSAVYLPQVATETGWDLETFLGRLSRKAGLSEDAWRRGATLKVFTAQVVEEER